VGDFKVIKIPITAFYKVIVPGKSRISPDLTFPDLTCKITFSGGVLSLENKPDHL
jgi:hypothetical protein